MSTSPAPPVTADTPEKRRTILITVCIALMAVIASVTGLNVAQQQIAVDFDASQSDVLWMINLYAITLAGLLLPLGALGDRIGRRPMLLTGLTVFGVANAAAGLAPNTTVMLAARLVSGIGAAMVMPVTLAVITSSFPPEERSKAIGVWTGVAGGGGIIGLFLSAVLVDVATWRWLFLLPVVLVAVAAVMAAKAIPDSRESSAHPFDLTGSALSVAAVLGLIWTLHEGPERGWTAPITLVSLAVGLSAAGAFGAWERRHPAPLLEVSAFTDRRLASGSMTLLGVFGVQAGIFVVLFPYFQAVLGWPGLRSTVALMPMAMLMMAASALAPRISAAAGNRATMTSGLSLGAGGLVLLATRVSVDGGYLSVLPGMAVMGIGMGMAMTPSTEAITSALPADKQGVASALNDVTREFGTALGVALLGAILTAGYRTEITDRLTGIAPGDAATAAEGIASALTIADPSDPTGARIVDAARRSFVDGWQQSMWAGAVVMTALAIGIAVFGPRTEEAERQPAPRAVPETAD